MKLNPLLNDLTPPHLGTFEDPLALCVEVVVSPQCLVEHVGTDTKLLGIELCKMADTMEVIKNNVILSLMQEINITYMYIVHSKFFYIGGCGYLKPHPSRADANTTLPSSGEK